MARFSAYAYDPTKPGKCKQLFENPSRPSLTGCEMRCSALRGKSKPPAGPSKNRSSFFETSAERTQPAPLLAARS